VSPHELTAPRLRHGGPDRSALRLLECGEVEIEGRMPWSSNATFLTTLRSRDAECRAVYKPGRGERPLWDFPHGLYRRELAAYLLSEALGWGLVPPTLIREGPLGEGSFQLFIEADFEQHYFTLYEQRPDLHPQLLAVSAFDVLANNTRPRRPDLGRRSGSVLRRRLQAAHRDLGLRRRGAATLVAGHDRAAGGVDPPRPCRAARRRRVRGHPATGWAAAP
jgi:hypothetical protein